MSIRFGTSTMRRTRPRFLRTRKLDWTTDGIDFLRLLVPGEDSRPLLLRGRTAKGPPTPRFADEARALLGPARLRSLSDPSGQRAARIHRSRAHKARTCGRDTCLCRRPGDLQFDPKIDTKALLVLDRGTRLDELLLHFLGVSLGNLLL